MMMALIVFLPTTQIVSDVSKKGQWEVENKHTHVHAHTHTYKKQNMQNNQGQSKSCQCPTRLKIDLNDRVLGKKRKMYAANMSSFNLIGEVCR